MSLISGIRVAVLGAVVGLSLSSGAAFACKGTQTLLRDDFTDVDPAWSNVDGSAVTIANGALTIHSDAGKFAYSQYGGLEFPGADACVTVVGPAAASKQVTQGGIGFFTGVAWLIAYVQSDGTAGVEGLQNGHWINPVPARKADGIKTGVGAANQIRLVWKAPPDDSGNQTVDPFVQMYINDKPFAKFKAQPNANRDIMLYAQTEGGSYDFKDLAITQ